MELIHRALVTCLVERSGYDRSLLETKPTNAFFAKGIVFDLERGVYAHARPARVSAPVSA